MKLFILMRVMFALVLLLGPVAQAQNAQPVAAPRPPGLETVEFFSTAVDRMMKFDIVFPSDYWETENRYPVLYLLHGYMQNYTVWGRNLAAGFYARNLDDLILVLPDGGNSWFVNYARSEDGQTNNWEDHIIEDVINYVDQNFRTEARREGRAISGLSMGGFGAFAMGLRHPEMFISIGSTSGALSYARSSAASIASGLESQTQQRSPQEEMQFAEADAFIAEIIAIPGFSNQDERTPKGTRFETEEQAKAYDPFEIIYNVPRSDAPYLHRFRHRRRAHC
ncbi:MAG: alpha/beta hydrolase-fold protein [Gammaproteobacteria bacterium]|nr:alpha/beta hydrolase-fold protein [Gammaproteobacteria bacterium]MDD9896430.1 alpha/beta hydrolase-fold protein [Gammaproteobacteria bacterium]